MQQTPPTNCDSPFQADWTPTPWLSIPFNLITSLRKRSGALMRPCLTRGIKLPPWAQCLIRKAERQAEGERTTSGSHKRYAVLLTFLHSLCSHLLKNRISLKIETLLIMRKVFIGVNEKPVIIIFVTEWLIKVDSSTHNVGVNFSCYLFLQSWLTLTRRLPENTSRPDPWPWGKAS